MSTPPLRSAMVPVTRRIRAYFAPVNRPTETATVFDPGKAGVFPLDTPPAPWIDLGYIDNFQRFCQTVNEPLRAGPQSAPAGQFRGAIDVRLEFDFREWGKLQMALAAGSEQMNILASDPDANPQPSGGTALPAVAVLPGSTATEIVVGAGVVNGFSVGDVVAVDSDYQQQTGYVGTGIAAAYVSDPTDVNQDVNYVRRVTFNVGRIAQLAATSLLLAQPLPGGAPAAGAGLQKVIAFVDREGGSFFQEWSGLFVAEEDAGGRVCFHYPRLSPTTTLQPATSAGSSAGPLLTQLLETATASQSQVRVSHPPAALRTAKAFAREEVAVLTAPIAALGLRAAFLALPYTDENDGQTVVCYRSYFPAAMAAVY